MTVFFRRVLLLCMAALVASCSDEPVGDGADGSDDGDCPSGKCDGIAETVEDYYSDMRDMSLDDLAGLGVGMATDELNDLLGDVPYVDIRLAETEFFGEPRELFGETVVEDLDKLRAGLTQRLGEQAFPTRVNAMRQASLDAGHGSVFAESSFRVGGSFSHGWSMDVGDAVGSVGFGVSPTLEAIVIGPLRRQPGSGLAEPLGRAQGRSRFRDSPR